MFFQLCLLFLHLQPSRQVTSPRDGRPQQRQALPLRVLREELQTAGQADATHQHRSLQRQAILMRVLPAGEFEL